MNEREVFIAALQKESAAERRAYLDAACGGDDGLRRGVEALLAAHERAGSFLEHPLVDPAVTTDDPISERPGTVIGPYRLMEQIGEGGMGLVFVAEQQQPVRRKVALKVIKPGMDTRQVVARFEAERQALALMDHPNIAKVFDGGTTDSGRPYFVMELVKGVPITEYCDHNQVPIRQRLELFVSVCQAVQHAHQKGIIHRDLKPSNALVMSHDGTPVVKIIDFGVAKAIGQQLTEKTIYTQFSQMVGTPLYMSPEQAGQSGLDVDTRSDIYSLGVLLYELLTSTTPFDRERMHDLSYDEMRRIIREEEPPKPSTRISTLGKAAATVSTQRQSEPKQLSRLFRGELDWIVMKALEKDRNRRYETANGLAMDVQRYLHDEPVQACPPSAAYRLRKFARRNKGRLAVAALAVFFLASLGGIAGWAALQHAAQRAALETDIGRDLDAARDFCRQDRLREASVVLDHAQALVERGGADKGLGGRVDLVRKDVDVAARLEAIRLERAAIKDEHFDLEGAALLYGEAFRDYGADVDKLDPEEAAARIKGSEIREQLLVALDVWLISTPRGNRKRLLDVLVRVDADPWRRQVRAAFVEEDLKALRALAQKANASGQPPSAATLMGQALRDLGEVELAVEFLGRAQQDHPSDLWLNLNLGSCLWSLKLARPGEAVGYLRVALALRPDSPGILNILGIALRDQGDQPGAVAAFQKAIALKPDFATARENLLHILRDQGDLPRAVAAFQEAIAFKPGYAQAYLNLGHALHALEDLPGAVAAFQKAIALKPDFAQAHLGLGEALEDQGDLHGAVAAYQKAIALKPDYAEDLRLAGVPARYYVRRSQWDKAAAEYAKADLWARPLNDDAFVYACLFLIRGDTEGYNRFCQDMIQHAAQTEGHWDAYALARSCAMARKSPVDPARAVQWAEQAVARDHSPWCFHVLGLAQYRAGQFDQALQSLTKADVNAWRYSELNWFPLALVHHRLGHPDEARQCFDKGIQWLERKGPPSPQRSARLLPQDWLEAQLLRREAEEVLRIKRSP
jgi:serine/threonine protein kinase/tetratricopeptide (TPR) repeat protein